MTGSAKRVRAQVRRSNRIAWQTRPLLKSECEPFIVHAFPIAPTCPRRSLLARSDTELVGNGRAYARESDRRDVRVWPRRAVFCYVVLPRDPQGSIRGLSLIHISEPTRPRLISYAVFCLKKKKRKKKRKKKKTFFFFFFNDTATTEIYTLSVVGSVRCV